MQKKKLFFKILAAALLLATCLSALPACEDNPENEGFNPYPYEDLSVYMDVPDYKSFTIEKTELERLINMELMSFCDTNGLTTELDTGTAQTYDYVYIKYNGKIDGQTFESGVSDGYYLLLGSGTFIDGFEDGVVGMEVGQTKDIEVRFPDNYGYIQYAGRDAVFTVELMKIIRMPEITDSICEKYSVYDTKDAFLEALMANCIFDYEWQILMSQCTLKGYPNKEYTQYYQSFIGYFEDLAEVAEMSLEDFLKEKGGYYRSYGLWRGITVDEMRQVATDYAKSNLVNDLLTYSIMRLENIQIEGEEWDAAIKILETENEMTFAQIVRDSGETAAIISVLTIRISQVLNGYVKIVD